MTDNTNQRRRHRAVFLAFIMIVSVFGGAIAFSGSAIADAPTDSNSNDVTPSEVTTPGGNNITVANVSFGGSNNVSNVTVGLSNENAVSVDTSDVNAINVTLINDSDGVAFNSTSFDQDPLLVNVTAGNFTNVSRVVVTAEPNDPGSVTAAGAVLDANLTLTESSTGDSLGITTQNTQDIDVGQVTANQTTSDVTEVRGGSGNDPIINVTFISASGINPSSVNVTVQNLNASAPNTTSLIESGEVVTGTKTSSSNFSTQSDNQITFANITAGTLREGTYLINASANTSNGNVFQNDTTEINRENRSFFYNRTGQSLEVITDDTNPRAGTNANISVVALDDDENRLVFNDSNLGAGPNDIQLSTTPTTTTALGAPTGLNFNKSKQNGTFFNVSLSDPGTVDIVAQDFSGNLSPSDPATQQFTGTISSITASSADGELQADGVDTENITVQLTDSNGNPIERSGETINYGITSGNAGATDANVSFVSRETQTDVNGTAVAELNATNPGFTIDVAVTGPNNTQSTASFDTVPGNVDPATSSLRVDNTLGTVNAEAGETLDINVSLQDPQSNPVPGTTVELSTNITERSLSFENPTPTTNNSGIATTSVTLPEQTGGVQINVSEGSFNASATTNALVNVSVAAGNTTALQFASDSRSLPANQDDVGVTVEGVDEFGNVNTSDIGSVTLTSSDTNVFDFNGGESASDNAGDGTADFNVDVGASGTATLTATVANSDINNTSAEFSATGPSSVDVTFSSDVSTSSNANNNTATLSAQLVGPDGSSIAIAGEQISLSASGPAELNQSGDFTPVTNANGLATYQVNATDQTGQTEITANALNFSAASGTGTITTTGPATDVSISFANDSVAQNNTTTVTTAFVDDSDRVVPRSGTITVQTINDVGEVDSGATASNATALANDFEATYTFNASTTESNATLRALAPGIGQTEATINVTGTQQDQPDQPDEVTSEVNFNDDAAPDGATNLTVDNATHDADFVIVAHTATDSDGDGDIQFNNANGNNEIGTKIGSSAIQSNGTQENIVVDLSKNVSTGDDIDSLAADEDQQIVMMLHVANESGDTNFGGNVKQADGETPVFDNNFVNVSSLDGAAGNADSDGDGEIGPGEVSAAVDDFLFQDELSRPEINEVIDAFLFG